MSTKRKNEKPDFEKKKQKVGKKLVPESTTNTSFKTRAIHMTDQGLEQAEGAITNERGQTLQDLLSKISHPSGSVRKEAVMGLRSLFDLHPEMLNMPVTLLSLFDKIATCMSDKDKGVRHALLLLVDSVVSRVTEGRMAPFFQLLMVHTSSAMTTMDSGVRLDSLDFLDIWISKCPSLTVRYGAFVLSNFLRLISTEYKSGQAGLSGKAGQITKALMVSPNEKLSTTQSRISVFNRLRTFLELLFLEGQKTMQHTTVDSAAASSSTSTTEAFSAPSSAVGAPAPVEFQAGIACSVMPLRPGKPLREATAMDVQEDKENEAQGGTSATYLLDPLRLLAFVTDDLLPLMLETWIEILPPSVEEGTDVAASVVANLNVIISMADLVFAQLDKAQTIEENWRKNFQEKVQRQFIAQFPLVQANGSRNMESESVVANVGLAEALSCLLPPSPEGRVKTPWEGKVVAFVASLLADAAQAAKAKKAGLSSALVQRIVTVCERLVTRIPESSDALFPPLFDFYSEIDEKSTEKRLIIHFLASYFINDATANMSDASLAILDDWVLSLPKLLWQLGEGSLPTTRAVLTLLVRLAARGTASNRTGAPIVDGIQKSFAFFFHAVGKKDIHRFGPFVHLPSDMQALALGVLCYPERMGAPVLLAVAQCCQTHNLAPGVVSKALEMAELKVRGGAPTADADSAVFLDSLQKYINLALALVTGYPAALLGEMRAQQAVTAEHPSSVPSVGLAGGVQILDPVLRRSVAGSLAATRLNLSDKACEAPLYQHLQRRSAVYRNAVASLCRMLSGEEKTALLVPVVEELLAGDLPLDTCLAVLHLCAHCPELSAASTRVRDELLSLCIRLMYVVHVLEQDRSQSVVAPYLIELVKAECNALLSLDMPTTAAFLATCAQVLGTDMEIAVTQNVLHSVSLALQLPHVCAALAALPGEVAALTVSVQGKAGVLGAAEAAQRILSNLALIEC